MRVNAGSSSASNYQTSTVLRQGSSGSDVRHLQQLLQSAGFSPGGIDGSFGPATNSAVLAFQRAHGLSADGVVGPKTWAALEGAGGAQAAPPASSGSTATLKQGSSGSSVAELQGLLAKAGFSPGAADGQFGPATREAVVSFQRAHGLSADGVVGPKTWAALRSGSAYQAAPTSSGSTATLKQGSSGSSVVELQGLLARAGFSAGAADGQFGPATRNAVVSFQRAAGLSADGVVGPKTWAALRSGSSYAASQASSSTSTSHPTLKLGSSGAAVSTLQSKLAAAGFSPGAIDGDFGGGTYAALKAFQRAAGLSADGVCGPQTWAALDGGSVHATSSTSAASGSLRERILSIAQAEVGTLEATGHNDGAVLKYPNYFGRGSEPYCADFVSWVLSQAGKPFNYAYCPYMKNHLVETGAWKGKSNPQPGDIVLFDWDGDKVADHVGLVRSVNSDGSVETIEGNTENPSTGRSGVFNRTRSLSCILGFGSV